MKTSKNICLIIIFIIVLGCSESVDNKKHGYINCKDISVKNVQISSIVDSIYYVRLETNNECLIKNIKQISIVSDRIFILDNYERLFVFSIKGKYLNQIGNIGKGPGEYLKISSFSIDFVNKIVFVLDENKISGYNYQGIYNNINIKTNHCNTFCYHNNLFYCYSPDAFSYYEADNKFKINVFNLDGVQVNAFLPITDIKKEKFVSFCSFYSKKNELFFLEPTSNKVYKVDDKSLTVKYNLVYGDLKKSRHETEDKEKFECKKILESNNILLIHYEIGNNWNLLYVDKTNNYRVNVKTKNNLVGFENDITSDLPIKPRFIFDDAWVEIIQPYDIIENTGRENHEEIANKFENLSVEENPIIRICKLRK